MLRSALVAFMGLALATGVAAQNTPAVTRTPLPSSVDASSFISDLYKPTPVPTGLSGPKVTEMASSLYSLYLSWENNPGVTSVYEAIGSAASRASDPAVISSLTATRLNWDTITTNAWYQENVPADIKSQVDTYNSRWDSIVNDVMDQKTNAAAGPMCTGAAIAAAGAALGVMAAL